MVFETIVDTEVVKLTLTEVLVDDGIVKRTTEVEVTVVLGKMVLKLVALGIVVVNSKVLV